MTGCSHVAIAWSIFVNCLHIQTNISFFYWAYWFDFCCCRKSFMFSSITVDLFGTIWTTYVPSVQMTWRPDCTHKPNKTYVQASLMTIVLVQQSWTILTTMKFCMMYPCILQPPMLTDRDQERMGVKTQRMILDVYGTACVLLFSLLFSNSKYSHKWNSANRCSLLCDTSGTSLLCAIGNWKNNWK